MFSRRAQTVPPERSSALNDDRSSDVRWVVAAATTAPARCAGNSTLGVLAMYWALPDMKASPPGRVSWEATPSKRAGEGVALAGVDLAERAMAWRALSTARDAWRAATLASSRA